MARDLSDLVDSLPTAAGVYLFKNRRGRVIYVGKAASLRARVRQYLTGNDERFMVPFLVSEATDVEVVRTHTAKDALILENTLIKKHRPRYNVKLRDDSNFLHIRLDRREHWPRFTLVRAIRNDGARYFGPFHSASKARDTLAFVERSFPMRTCSDNVLKTRKRPCLLHQMGRCMAPCVPGVEPAAYEEAVDEAVLFLEGKHRPLVDKLAARMQGLAEELAFEQAARVRDLIRNIEDTLERQRVVDRTLADRDCWGLYREGRAGAVAMIPVREGVMGQPLVTQLDKLVDDGPDLWSSLLNNAYPEGAFLPPEVLVPEPLDDADALAELLSERRGKRVTLRVPQRGDKRRMVELARENARVAFRTAHDEATRRARALEDLAKIVGLPAPPRRIECFDNSNLQGTNPVAAMSVLIDGQPDRQEFRRYKVKTVVGADDYATMREILERRVRRGLEDGVLPDLLVVDGGKGQLGVALAVLEDLGLPEQPVIGLSKPRTERRRGDRHAPDKIVLPHAKDPIVLKPNDPALHLLQRVRDEAHRHAIRYHRKVRSKNTITSVLEAIPGVGPARRKALLKHLGSASAVLDASIEQLAEVPGIGPELARDIHDTVRTR